MTPTFFISFLAYEYQKKRRKLFFFWQKLLQISSIEEDKLQFCTFLLPVTYSKFFVLFYHFLKKKHHNIIAVPYCALITDSSVADPVQGRAG
jgi:hypothetical protein